VEVCWAVGKVEQDRVEFDSGGSRELEEEYSVNAQLSRIVNKFSVSIEDIR
jgi:hypothetical protein